VAGAGARQLTVDREHGASKGCEPGFDGSANECSIELRERPGGARPPVRLDRHDPLYERGKQGRRRTLSRHISEDHAKSLPSEDKAVEEVAPNSSAWSRVAGGLVVLPNLLRTREERTLNVCSGAQLPLGAYLLEAIDHSR
jgi:hypothetical protein